MKMRIIPASKKTSDSLKYKCRLPTLISTQTNRSLFMSYANHVLTWFVIGLIFGILFMKFVYLR